MRNTTGYFFDVSKSGGLMSQYWIFWPAGVAAVRLWGSENVTSLSHAAFSCVSGLMSLPSADTRKISAGAVNVDFENTAKPAPGRAAEIDPP